MTPGRSDHADETSGVACRRISRCGPLLHQRPRRSFAVLNACLTIEEAYRREQFVTLELLLSCRCASSAPVGS
jgi:hypothetical protein